MNMPLPTKAKMTALVCSGRMRPKVMNGVQVQLRPEQLAGDEQPGGHADQAPDRGRDRKRAHDAVVVFEGFDAGSLARSLGRRGLAPSSASAVYAHDGFRFMV